MAEAQQSRVQEAVEEMIQTLERDHIRKIQGRMFRCSAECCERSGDSMNQVHQCIERCHAPMGKAQAVVTNELQQFQDRLTRCTMHCSDKAKDMFDSGAKEPAMRALMDTCVSACVDEHLKLLPSISRRLQDSLNPAL